MMKRRMRGWLSVLWACVFLLSLLGAPLTSANAALTLDTDADYAAVDAYLTEMMQRAGLPGLSLAIVRGDQVAYLRGYGAANAAGAAVTEDTSFLLGSISKSFTATAVLQLVDAGRLQLDTPVQRYLPWFQVADPQASAQITVRHLLNHTAGFGNGQGLAMFTQQPEYGQSIEDAVRSLHDTALAHPPGDVYEYSNVNYVVLGQLIQTVSGETYEQYIEQHVFRPLGMTHSFTSLATAEQNGMAQGFRSTLGLPVGAPYQIYREYGLPCGYLIASAQDIAHYLIMQMNGGRYGGEQILSPQSLDLMHSPGVLNSGARSDYGMGWGVGPNGYSHDGQVENFFSHMVVHPQQQLGIVLMANEYNVLLTEDMMHGLVEGIEQILQGQVPAYQDTGYWQTYLLFDLILLVLAVVAVRLFYSLKGWQEQVEAGGQSRWRNWIGPLVQTVLIATVLFGVPLYTPVSWSTMLYTQPDVAGTVYGLLLVLLIHGASKLVLLVAHVRYLRFREQVATA